MGSLHERFSLNGRVAWVTGAAGWLGLPMATGLAEAGAHVILSGRTEAPLQELAATLTRAGCSAEVCVLDVTDAEAVRRAVEGVQQRHGHLSVLVNNAASAVPGPKGLNTDPASFGIAYDSMVTAAWRLTIACRPLLRKAVERWNDASVVNIASMYAKVAPDPKVYTLTNEPPNPPFYGPAKAALIQLSRWLAANLGPEGIRVNSVSPGPFPQGNKREQAPQFVGLLDEKTLLGRVGHREEVAGAVVFLASGAASFITGTDLAVDGGWTSR